MEDNNKNISRSDEISELLSHIDLYYVYSLNEGLIDSNYPDLYEIIKRLIDLNVTAEDLKDYLRCEYPDE